MIKAELATQRFYEAIRHDLNTSKSPEIKIRFDSNENIAETEIKFNQLALRLREFSKLA
jgi:hypothetical protein